jgi:hypothetical protein
VSVSYYARFPIGNLAGASDFARCIAFQKEIEDPGLATISRKEEREKKESHVFLNGTFILSKKVRKEI